MTGDIPRDVLSEGLRLSRDRLAGLRGNIGELLARQKTLEPV